MKKNKGKKWDFFLIKEKQVNRLNFFFHLFFYHKGVPPFAQGNGWDSTSPWHMQHNELITTMQ
jgi:hypothetical protein